jgi:hypothetical protein
MKRYFKNLMLLLVLGMIAGGAYQIWQFMAFYNQVRDALEETLMEDQYVQLVSANDTVERDVREQLIRSLIKKYEAMGIELEPKDISIREDRPKREVRVEFSYQRELRILVFSFQKQMLVWRTRRDVDFG